MATIAEQIEAKKQELVQLKVRQQKMEAIKRAEEKKALRRDDTRRKILIGAAFMARHGVQSDALRDLMAPTLARDDDRALFGLAPVAQHPDPEKRAA